ncbi:MAG: carboxylating nicotinate-nucleotide diphosphorylase [Planctomycetales bacterium]|nr:carboxylating nicotinate-nucleotide diphosphorylase [Planctomycetales bacterium]
MTTRDFRQIQWDSQLEEDCRRIVRQAVSEDLDRGHDLTTAALIARDTSGEAAFVARQTGIACGLQAAKIACEEMDLNVAWQAYLADGDTLAPGVSLASYSGTARDMLTGERVALNLLCKLSGIASLTREYVDRIAGTKAAIYDTRKTTPGWRHLEKYAVRCGGARNHRTGLYDAVLIKDNHLAIAGHSGPLSEAVTRAREFVQQQLGSGTSSTIIEIEVDTLDQFREVLPVRPDIVLLDNMAPEQLTQAVRLRDAEAPDVQLEASGGINLNTIRAVAETGVDRISVGALTHAAPWLDIGLDWKT